MSIQAVGWALTQEDIPQTPTGRSCALVLIVLCNYADEQSGHCWPGAERIAKAARCSLRSVYSFLSALQRNGFIDIRKVRGVDGKQRSNNYWILFDRPHSTWKGVTGRSDEPSDPEDNEDASPQDVGVRDEAVAPGKTSDQDVDNAVENPSTAPGPGASHFTRHIMIEPSESEPSLPDSLREAPEPPHPQEATKPQPIASTVPPTYDPKIREAELRREQAASDAAKAAPVFVIEGTRAWLAWKARKSAELRRPWNLTADGTVNGKRARGWWFPTLFPPRSRDGPGMPDTLGDVSSLGDEMGGKPGDPHGRR